MIALCCAWLHWKVVEHNAGPVGAERVWEGKGRAISHSYASFLPWAERTWGGVEEQGLLN